MRIVDRAAFLAMPKGTVYAKFEPIWWQGLAIKEASIVTGGDPPGRGDWFYQDIADAIATRSGVDVLTELEDLTEQSLATGSSIPMDFDGLGRDGLFEPDQLFAVWEQQDVRALIERLQRALRDADEVSGG